MNRKGFTLIELLAVIIVIALIATIVTPSVIEYVNSAKNTSYNLLIKSIVSASKTYYEECEYGDLSDNSKYENYACKINKDEKGDYIITNLGTLANTGMLSVNDVDSDNKKIVINPKDNTDISSCDVIIKKKVEISKESKETVTNYKVTYNISSKNCSYINGSIN
jgi:hypothetical protein